MTPERFAESVEKMLNQCNFVLLAKNEEYSRDGDRLHNFKSGTSLTKETPEKVLAGMMLKHVISIYDMISDIEHQGKLFTEAQWNEKIGDNINYLLLLKGLVTERGFKPNVKETI